MAGQTTVTAKPMSSNEKAVTPLGDSASLSATRSSEKGTHNGQIAVNTAPATSSVGNTSININANATTHSNNTSTPASTTSSIKKKSSSKPHQTENHEALSDAVAASGVNIRAEEEAMIGGLSISKRQIEQNSFLKLGQLEWFMQKTLEEQGSKSIIVDNEVGNLISASCEFYMREIVTDLIVMMRHRRHASDAAANKAKGNKSSKGSKHSSSLHSGINSKSEISKALRDLAAKHKEREEKRIRRRVLLGLDEEKVEENLVQDHKQTNLTASLMMNGSKKSKYSWMQSSSTTSNSSFNSHGDNGIRYREAREEQSVVLRDLIAALENRRIGASNALLKAYARLKD